METENWSNLTSLDIFFLHFIELLNLLRAKEYSKLRLIFNKQPSLLYSIDERGKSLPYRDFTRQTVQFFIERKFDFTRTTSHHRIIPMFVKAVIRNDIEIFKMLIEYQIEGTL